MNQCGSRVNCKYLYGFDGCVCVAVDVWGYLCVREVGCEGVCIRLRLSLCVCVYMSVMYSQNLCDVYSQNLCDVYSQNLCDVHTREFGC
jgi:hypothetical protein